MKSLQGDVGKDSVDMQAYYAVGSHGEKENSYWYISPSGEWRGHYHNYGTAYAAALLEYTVASKHEQTSTA
jgi:hypothetical protein